MAKAVPEFLFWVPTLITAHIGIWNPTYKRGAETPTSFSSRVERTEKCYVPWLFGLLIRLVDFVLDWFLGIYKIIRIIMESLAHYEWPLPWR